MALRGGLGGGGSGGLWRDMPPPRPLFSSRSAAESLAKKKAARSAPTGAYGVPVQRPPGYEDDESQESDAADTVTNRRVLARRRRNRERRQRLREHRQREQEVGCVGCVCKDVRKHIAYIHKHTHKHTHTRTHTRARTHTPIYLHIYISIYISICMYVCVCVCVYVCVCVCVCVYE